jgi:hypothetical protein
VAASIHIPAVLPRTWTAGNGIKVVAYRTTQALLVWTFISVPLGVLTETLWHAPKVCDMLPFRNPLLPFLVALFLILNSPRRTQTVSATPRSFTLEIA